MVDLPKDPDEPKTGIYKNIFDFLKQYSRDIGQRYYQGSVPDSKTTQYLTEEVLQALQSIKHNQITLILGKAGTGKSTFIKNISSATKRLALVAPTGIAAQTIGGATIHSFFGLLLDVQKPEYVNTSEMTYWQCSSSNSTIRKYWTNSKGSDAKGHIQPNTGICY